MTTKQILQNATTGESDEFFYSESERSISFKLVIVGVSSTPISAFVAYLAGLKALMVGTEGISGGGASVKVQRKFNHPNSEWKDTGDMWSEDDASMLYFQ
jgi:hypothetical protein